MNNYILGGVIALVLLMASYMIYERVSKSNDAEILDRVQKVQQMGKRELDAYKGDDPIIKAERGRRHEEVMNSLRAQNRD